jgi:hypothetical protein
LRSLRRRLLDGEAEAEKNGQPLHEDGACNIMKYRQIRRLHFTRQSPSNYRRCFVSISNSF